MLDYAACLKNNYPVVKDDLRGAGELSSDHRAFFQIFNRRNHLHESVFLILTE
jgi:hypothetical protein